MVATENHTKKIIELVHKVQNEELLFEEIYNNQGMTAGKNEFLFFIKPEITLKSTEINLEKILNLVQDKIESFGFNIHNIKILSAAYLEQYNIVAQHYGVINKISSNAIENISDGAKEKFKELYGKSVTELKVLGGIEFLNQQKDFNAYSLDYLWQNLENKKLAGGTYCEAIKIDNTVFHLINGFHPRQLKHFTEKGRCIVVFTLSGNLNWADARSNFIGATNPANANPGSLRREFLERKNELGLSEVSQGVNGVHLSAGPVEALVELVRYNSNFSQVGKRAEISDYEFGKKLNQHFSTPQIEKILSNANLDIAGKAISVFDLTEEKDSDEALDLLKKYMS